MDDLTNAIFVGLGRLRLRRREGLVIYQYIECFDPHLSLQIAQSIQQISPLTSLENEWEYKRLLAVVFHNALLLHLRRVVNRCNISERNEFVIFVIIRCLFSFLNQAISFLEINNEPPFRMSRFLEDFILANFLGEHALDYTLFKLN